LSEEMAAYRFMDRFSLVPVASKQEAETYANAVSLGFCRSQISSSKCGFAT
jgi:hypothetical protein